MTNESWASQSAKRQPRLVLGSSAHAETLAADLVGKVGLVVTSPPYHNAISYDSHAEDPNADYRRRYSQDYANDYMALLNSVWTACLRMLRPGGYLAINVGSVLEDGYHYPLAEDIIGELARTKESEFVRSIFWHKVTAGVKRAGSVIQHPYPGYWHPNIMTEHIILVRRPGAIRLPNSDVPEEWLQPVWDIAPVPPRTINHPAPFPEDIPHRLIRMFTVAEDWVMDPFNGAGSTTKAAFDLGRNSVGFDIEPRYIDVAQQRLSSVASVREKQLAVAAVPATDFVPGRSRGKTRHGSGLGSRRT